MQSAQLIQLLTLFTLVAARLGGLVAVAPVFGSRHVPIRFRALFAAGLALLIVPLQSQVKVVVQGWLELVVLVGGELLIGLTLGIGIVVLFSGIRVAGQLISQMGGVQFAEVFSPNTEESVPIVSELIYLVALAVFLTSGGYRTLVIAVLDTFQALPLAGGIGTRSLVEVFTTLLGQSFALGLRAAAPVVASLLLATLVTGLISRTLPQFNTAVSGIGLNAVTMLCTLGLTLGAAAWLFNSQVEPVLEQLVDALHG